MYLKGQSALENLITYGWMLVAVSVIGSIIYGSNLGGSCEIGVDSPFGTSPVINDAIRTEEGKIALRLRNPEDNSINIDELRFKRNGEILTSVDLNKNIRGEASSGYKTTNFQNSENCNSYTVEAEYSSSTLNNLVSKATIKGKISIVRILSKFDVDPLVAEKSETVDFDASPSESSNTIEDYSWEFGGGGTATGITASNTWNSNGAYSVKLTITDEKGNTATKTKTVYVGGIIFEDGGSTQKIGINSTLAANCIGDNCTNATGGEENSIFTGGDKMKGTLLTENITEEQGEICLTSNQSLGDANACPKTRTPSQNNTLTDDNNVMWGSLEAPVIKPLNNKICIGEC